MNASQSITVSTRRVNVQRKLLQAPIYVDVPCLEVGGKFAGDLPKEWDIEKAKEAAKIASAVREAKGAASFGSSDPDLAFMVQQMLQA